jgi:hypothetical protein
MSSESVCQVARSWVDVGSFHSRFSGEVYGFDSVSPEYFGYILIYHFQRFWRSFKESWKALSGKAVELSEGLNVSRTKTKFVCTRTCNVRPQMTSFLWSQQDIIKLNAVLKGQIQGVFKKRPNFLNSAPTSTERALRLLRAPSVRF